VAVGVYVNLLGNFGAEDTKKTGSVDLWLISIELPQFFIFFGLKAQIILAHGSAMGY